MPVTAQGFTQIDLHTLEMPIDRSAFDTSVEKAGLAELAVNGILTVYAVPRSSLREPSRQQTRMGMNGIYKMRTCWMPELAQSKRGMSIYLSSLRVFCRLVRHGKHTEELHDGILHLLDLLSRFPPALRAMHILLHGKTPTQQECGALSYTLYHVLADIVPPDLINKDDSRRFEGSRMLSRPADGEGQAPAPC